MTARSCTASSSGTSGSVTGGVRENSVKTCRSTRAPAAAFRSVRGAPTSAPRSVGEPRPLPALRPSRAGTQTPLTAASWSRRCAREGARSASTISPSLPSASPTKKASKNGATGSGLAVPGPPPMTMGSPSPRSAACSGTPARSSISSTLV